MNPPPEQPLCGKCGQEADHLVDLFDRIVVTGDYPVNEKPRKVFQVRTKVDKSRELQVSYRHTY